MALFKKKENSGYLDLDKHLSKQEEKLGRFQKAQSSSDEESGSPTHQLTDSPTQSSGFFGGFFGGSAQASEVQTQTESSPEEKRKKLIKRVIELTKRMEEQEKEIYQLKNRLEVLERKQKLGY